MTDFKLALDEHGRADLVFEDGDLAVDESLHSAVLISLFTDARAQASDVLPDSSTNRRGYWADSAVSGSGVTGSRLWLLERAKQTGDVLERTQEYAREGLDWLREDKVAAAVAVAATAPVPGMRLLDVRIDRGAGSTDEFTMEVPT